MPMAEEMIWGMYLAMGRVGETQGVENGKEHHAPPFHVHLAESEGRDPLSSPQLLLLNAHIQVRTYKCAHTSAHIQVRAPLFSFPPHTNSTHTCGPA